MVVYFYVSWFDVEIVYFIGGYVESIVNRLWGLFVYDVYGGVYIGVIYFY